MKSERICLNGVVLLDKPVGYSSNEALMQAKRILKAKKAGHTGTLDPFATGLLPLCFGEATKFSADLFKADKTYEATALLGVKTQTGDSEGEVVARAEVNVMPAQVEQVLAQFLGQQQQTPPMYSALKRDGKPLYEYARAGIVLEREPRAITIHELVFLGLEGALLKFRVTCSKGTYVRVLAEDIGAALGCGAHLVALRRTQVGDLKMTQACTLEQLNAAQVLPVDSLLQTLPAIKLNESDAARFCLGQRLKLKEVGGGRVRVYAASNEQLLGTAQLDDTGRLQPERVIEKKTEQKTEQKIELKTLEKKAEL